MRESHINRVCCLLAGVSLSRLREPATSVIGGLGLLPLWHTPIMSWHTTLATSASSYGSPLKTISKEGQALVLLAPSDERGDWKIHESEICTVYFRASSVHVSTHVNRLACAPLLHLYLSPWESAALDPWADRIQESRSADHVYTEGNSAHIRSQSFDFPKVVVFVAAPCLLSPWN